MNERVMQFRIGMFVIVAGLVLIMMIVWFGESPTILRDQVFLRVHYLDAPGIAEGIPVRRSGIKIGEVSAVEFDDRPGQPDGVIVILALERPKAKLKQGSVPKIARALIGDVAIEMTPGSGTEPLAVGDSPAKAPLIEGDVSPDPAKALAAATQAFERVGGTLTAIEDAAKGIANVTKRAEHIDELIAELTQTGKTIKSVGRRIDDTLKTSAADIGPAIAGLRSGAEKFNSAFDEKTVADLKGAIQRLSTASARLDAGLADLKPVLADLGAPVNVTPVTNLGQTMWRANRITSDLNLLTRLLRDENGNLNANGSIQQLFISPTLHNNINKMVAAATEVVNSFRPVVASLRSFAERLNRDPASLTRGALNNR